MITIDDLAVNIPEGSHQGMTIRKFTVEEDNFANLRLSLRGRGTRPGTYTALLLDGKLWMSDTDAERKDHLTPLRVAKNIKAERVLVNGLGLGMVLNGFLSIATVRHVDVVEKDERVIKLVGDHYANDPRVRIHHADAYEQTKKWPTGTRWDVGWSDIWADISSEDLPTMAKMNRSYGRRCSWHRCWGQDKVS